MTLFRISRTVAAAALSTALLLGTAAPQLSMPATAASTPTQDPALKQTVSEKEAYSSGQVVRNEGHMDLGPKLVDGKLEFAVRDDTQLDPVWRHLRDLVVQVGDKAKIKMPEGDTYSFTGAKAGDEVWIIPQVEQRGVPWLGWNTQDPGFVNDAKEGVTMRFAHVQGPGQLSVFLQNGDFGEPQVLYGGKNSADVHVDLNTHTHANWVFTKPGIYLMTVILQSGRKDDSKHEDTQLLRFAVGDSADPKEAAQAQVTDAPKGGADQPAAQGAGQQGPDKLALMGIGAGIIALLAALFFAVVAIVNRKRRREAALAGGQSAEGEPRAES